MNDDATDAGTASPNGILDGETYRFIHELLKANPPASERREKLRQPCASLQLVAPYMGQMPEAAEFRHVEFRDLSETGFSYIAWEPPPSDQVVVAMGRAPFRFFFAQVVRCARPDDDMLGPYCVGCQFSERLVE